MPFLVCGHGPQGHHLTGGRRPVGAQAISYQKPEPHQFQKIHEIQSPGVYPQRKGHFETGERLILNTKGEGEKSSEDFWVKAERLYYSALIGYIWYEAEPEERNFITLLDLINASEAREDDEEFQSPVDLLFAKLEKEQPDHFAVKQYRKFQDGCRQNSEIHPD